jgi:RNA polymerase primary sigma factor
MEPIEEHMLYPAASLSVVVDESPEFPDSDFQESDDFGSNPEPHAGESVTDDPVRVYLREMGSVSLLKRQGEIDLAKRMERGKLRMQKALSRSPLVWKSVLALFEDVRQAKVRLVDFLELGIDDARERATLEVMGRIAKLARLSNRLLLFEPKIAATPNRYVNVRAKLMGKTARLKVKCSQEVRGIPFRAEQWKQFRGVVERALEEISRLERERVSVRELDRREIERELREPRGKVRWKPGRPNRRWCRPTCGWLFRSPRSM